MTGTSPAEFATDDRRWAAIEGRDSLADGAFVYAVRTTGVYCRPTCRSRRPNRANVAFFDHPGAAERAGFRACKRCQPGVDRPESGHARIIERACLRLEKSEGITLDELAAEVGLSPGYFHRVFKQSVGVTPKEFAMSVRLKRLRDGLAEGQTIAGGILGAGFGSIGRAYDESAEGLGMTPGQYRSGGEGRSIRYATADTSLGRVLVAATELGICSIELGDSSEGLIGRLVERFPNAELAGDDPDFADRLKAVVELVDRPGIGLDLPLDIRGTAFQRQVWEVLRAIPIGSTATYSEVARKIGRPSATRAVARACASNELAVVIPCHRVIRGDGGLGGYRWGIERKQALLDVEAEDR
jgi:AraC family transcriptional regulator, regulatory protein of adaptative response / methylated-DNA-[protein]-cysteine methyltransferase